MIRFFRSSLEKLPLLIQTYRIIRDSLDKSQPFIRTPWGFYLSGHTSMANGFFEPVETELIRRLTLNVDIFVNVGANIGYYCCHALSLGKKVLAVEPIARNVHYLLRNLAKNGWSNVEVFPLAISSNIDISKIWGSGTGSSLIKGWAGIPSSYVSLVPVSTFDRLFSLQLSGKQSLILIDAEGSEFNILNGAINALCLSPKPIWFVEICSSENQPQGSLSDSNLLETFELFWNHGYSSYSAELCPNPISFNDVSNFIETNSFPTHNYIFTDQPIDQLI